MSAGLLTLAKSSSATLDVSPVKLSVVSTVHGLIELKLLNVAIPAPENTSIKPFDFDMARSPNFNIFGTLPQSYENYFIQTVDSIDITSYHRSDTYTRSRKISFFLSICKTASVNCERDGKLAMIEWRKKICANDLPVRRVRGRLPEFGVHFLQHKNQNDSALLKAFM